MAEHNNDAQLTDFVETEFLAEQVKHIFCSILDITATGFLVWVRFILKKAIKNAEENSFCKEQFSHKYPTRIRKITTF